MDFIVKDIKKNENSSEAVEEIADSVNKEIQSKIKTNIDYKHPDISLLDDSSGINNNALDYPRKSALKGAKKLEETLKSFGVDAKVLNVSGACCYKI